MKFAIQGESGYHRNLGDVGGLDVKALLFPYFFTILSSPNEVAYLTEKSIVSEQLFVSYMYFTEVPVYREKSGNYDVVDLEVEYKIWYKTVEEN